MIGPLAYVGGKRRLAPALIALFPPHVTYVEPFAGGAQVFFAKSPSRVEILNDLSGDVVNFLRVCQHHPDELIRQFRFAPASRALHALAQAQDPTALTDIQRAARFLYLQKNSFGGLVVHQHYHICVTKPSNFNPDRLPDIITATSHRLARTQIESLPYEQVLERYDRDTTLFYLDPPYIGLTLYRVNFRDDEFLQLADRLASIRGKFVLSINDHPLARQAFARFFMTEVSLAYTAAPSVPTVRELVFANFPLPTTAALTPRP